MRKRILAALLAGVMVFSLAACSSGGSSSQTADNGDSQEAEETEIQVFIAASLNTVMTELAEMYNEEHPEVKITYNPDSSGKMCIRDRGRTATVWWRQSGDIRWAISDGTGARSRIPGSPAMWAVIPLRG